MQEDENWLRRGIYIHPAQRTSAQQLRNLSQNNLLVVQSWDGCKQPAQSRKRADAPMLLNLSKKWEKKLSVYIPP